MTAASTVNRNAPCPCGSGKRFKSCHGTFRNGAGMSDDEAEQLVDAGLRALEEERADDALRLFRRVLDARPEDIVAAHNLGVARMKRGEAAAAIPLLERTLASRPDDPRYLDNLGLAYAQEDRIEDAIAMHSRALALDANRPGTWSNLGNALRLAGRQADAEAAFLRALAIEPTHVKARWHYATARLAMNDATAWKDFELRWNLLGVNLDHQCKGIPRWRGEDIAGRTILVDDEQGFGDVIQSARHLAELAARGARVVVRTRAPLANLLATAPGVAEVMLFQAAPAGDVWVPFMSLPGLLGVPPHGDGAPTPYLQADATRVDDLRERLMRVPARLRVGLAWAGNPMQQNNRRRSMPLSALAPLLERRDIAWYSLQRIDGEDEIAAVPAARALHSLPERYDFDGKAALVSALDLVISVCTSSAHLAGALGRPLWLALPRHPDWRWGDAGTTSAWYPKARLFRQPARGDWASVVRDLGSALDRIVS